MTVVLGRFLGFHNIGHGDQFIFVQIEDDHCFRQALAGRAVESTHERGRRVVRRGFRGIIDGHYGALDRSDLAVVDVQIFHLDLVFKVQVGQDLDFGRAESVTFELSSDERFFGAFAVEVLLDNDRSAQNLHHQNLAGQDLITPEQLFGGLQVVEVDVSGPSAVEAA